MNESEENFKEKLTEWFVQMMFVSGETAEPSADTTGMIEELVKQQVIEMVSLIRRVLEQSFRHLSAGKTVLCQEVN